MSILKGSKVRIIKGEFAGLYGIVERTPVVHSADLTKYYVRVEDGTLIYTPDHYLVLVRV